MKVTEKDIIEARKTADALDLKDAELLSAYPIKRIEKICNGIGPEWFPEKLRQMIDCIHPSLKIPAMIHDLHYYNGNGTKEDFKNANDNFRDNGITISKYLYGWYDPRRYLAIHEAKKFAIYCDLFGKTAYDSAIKERKEFQQSLATHETANLKKVIKTLENTKKIMENMEDKGNVVIKKTDTESSEKENTNKKRGEENGLQDTKCIKDENISGNTEEIPGTENGLQGRTLQISKTKKTAKEQGDNKKPSCLNLKNKSIASTQKTKAQKVEGNKKCSEKKEAKKRKTGPNNGLSSRPKSEGQSLNQEKKSSTQSPSSSLNSKCSVK